MSRSPKFIGSIDQGTTSTRFILFDSSGAIVSSGQKEFTQHLPEEGRTEHDPMEIFDTVTYCVDQALSANNPKNTLQRTILLSEIDCVGITNQRETTVVWDKQTGIPYYRALVWMDMRSENICNTLTSEHALGQERFRSKTGLPVSPYFSGTKIMWLLENVPGLREAANNGNALFGTIDSWLLSLVPTVHAESFHRKGSPSVERVAANHVAPPTVRAGLCCTDSPCPPNACRVHQRQNVRTIPDRHLSRGGDHGGRAGNWPR
jgi:glycerol kinase